MEHGLAYSVLVLVVVVMCYWNSLGCGFVFDDMSAIKDNKDLRPNTPISNLFWNDFWGTPMQKERSHKSYRPLCVLTFRWNYALSELEPMSYHLVNLILHGIVCVLYLRLCSLFVGDTASLVAALLFAVHPVHTEAVTGVVGRAELLSSIFIILALFSYRASATRKKPTGLGWLCMTIILVAIATLCKEQGITAIGMCCVYEVFVVQQLSFIGCLSLAKSILTGKPSIPQGFKGGCLRILLLVGSTVFLLMARIKVMGAQLPVFTKFDNPAAASATPTRQLTFNYLLALNAWLLLCPSWLCCDWTMGTVPLVDSVPDIRNLATLGFYTVLGLLVHYAMVSCGKKCQAVIMALSLLVFPYTPASNLFFPVGFVVAERILYAPSMGFCLLVALGFELLTSKNRNQQNLVRALMVLLLLSHGVKTFRRNYDWESEYSIFQAALKVNQRNAKCFNNVGHALEGEKRFDEALGYFKKAASVQPDDIGAHINVGRTFNVLNMHQEAEAAYRRALALMPPIKPGQSYTTRIAPNHLNAFLNLGNLLAKNQTRLLEADALYRQAISMRADYVQAYINRGDVLMKLNRTLEAQQQYETALQYEDSDPDIYYNLGVVLLEQGQQQPALVNFNKALGIDPNHKQTLFNSALLLSELGDPKFRLESKKRFEHLLKFEPDNEKIYFNLAMIGVDTQNYNEAEKWYRKAIELQPDFRSALFNLALMLVNDVKKPMEALPIIHQLLKYYPDHTKAMILLGDININHLKDPASAEKNFLRIIELEPDNVQAHHNLCVVYVEQGDLHKAERCLTTVLQMAPHEDYVRRHLGIVRHRLEQQSLQKQKGTQSQDKRNGD